MNRFHSLLTAAILPTFLALACGGAFLVFANDVTVLYLMILIFVGIFGLLAASHIGRARDVILLALGFATIINPRKFFWLTDATEEELLPWTVSVHFVTMLDIVVLVLFLTYARHAISAFFKILPVYVRLFIGIFVAALFLSLLNVNVIDNVSIAHAHIGFELKGLILFIVVFGLVTDRRYGDKLDLLRMLLIGLCCGIAVEVLVVGLEYVGILTEESVFLGIRVGSFEESLVTGGEALRVGGTYQHPNFLGVPAGMILLLFWQLHMDSHKDVKSTPIFWLGIIGGAICVVMPLSRGAWSGLLAGAALYVLVMLFLRGKAWLDALPWRYIVPALIVLVGVGLWFFEPIYGKLTYSNPMNLTSRAELNRITIDAIMEEPLIGHGAGQHGFALLGRGEYNTMSIEFGFKPLVHNSYLLIASEIGIIGAACFFLIPIVAILKGIMACIHAPNHKLTGLLCALVSCLVMLLATELVSPGLRRVDIANLYWLIVALTWGVVVIFDRDRVAEHKRDLLHRGTTLYRNLA